MAERRATSSGFVRKKKKPTETKMIMSRRTTAISDVAWYFVSGL